MDTATDRELDAQRNQATARSTRRTAGRSPLGSAGLHATSMLRLREAPPGWSMFSSRSLLISWWMLSTHIPRAAGFAWGDMETFGLANAYRPSVPTLCPWSSPIRTLSRPTRSFGAQCCWRSAVGETQRRLRTGISGCGSLGRDRRRVRAGTDLPLSAWHGRSVSAARTALRALLRGTPAAKRWTVRRARGQPPVFGGAGASEDADPPGPLRRFRGSERFSSRSC